MRASSQVSVDICGVQGGIISFFKVPIQWRCRSSFFFLFQQGKVLHKKSLIAIGSLMLENCSKMIILDVLPFHVFWSLRHVFPETSVWWL